ncbi:MAG: molecular chaperone HscC [Ruminococcus sp.]|nr:molecular chaperone HscC [Ruminococcus sp.]
MHSTKKGENIMAIIGIDLGTTNSLAVCWKNGKKIMIKNSLGDIYTPSAVSIDEKGEVLVGKAAAQRLISHPGCTVSEFKRYMGTNRKYKLGENEYSPEELSSFVLRKIKQDAEAFLGEPVEEAIISVPAYFDDNCRNATKLAAKLSGLNVERLINEPSAAALAYIEKNKFEDGTYMIVDFGGGTLDISVVDTFDGVIEILAVSGDNQLGGKDFNNAIVKYFCDENGLDESTLSPESRAIIYKNAEQCKMALTDSPMTVMISNIDGKQYSAVLDNNRLIKISADIFNKISFPIKKALHDSRCSVDDIEEIILVGGSCHMPVVKAFIEKLMNRSPENCINPDTAIAIGAGIFGGIKARNNELKDIILTDICPYSLGISVYETKTNEELMEFLIPRNTSLPASRVNIFNAIKDDQERVHIKIYQGESMLPAKNLFLGELEVQCPKTKKDEIICSVRLTYDINGILVVDVVTNDNKNYSKTILSKRNQMTDEQISECIKKLEALKISPFDEEENRLLISRAEALYEEALPDEREIIKEYLLRFKRTLQTNNKHEIRNAYSMLEKMIDEWGF